MQLRLLYVVSGTEGEHLWVSFLDFLFDLVESISIEVVRGLDEVCRISYNFRRARRNSSSGGLLRRKPSSSVPWPMGSTSSF